MRDIFWRWWRSEWGVLVVALAGLLVLAALTWACRSEAFFTLADIRAAQLDLAGLSAREPWAVAFVYFCTFVALTALCLPGALVLLLLAGASFGLVWGSLLAVLASTVGATLTMLVARHWLRPVATRKLGAWIGRFEHQLQGGAATNLLSLRLLPVIPFVLVNVLSGVLGVRTLTFFWTGLLGMLPATVAYVNAGQQLAQVQSLHGLLSPVVMGALLALGLLPLLARQLARRLRRRFNTRETVNRLSNVHLVHHED